MTGGEERRPQGKGGALHNDSHGRQEVTARVAQELEIARSLAAAGIPVFCAYPDPEGETASGRATGYRIRAGWETTSANPAYAGAWKPDMALCAVMGHGLDLVDVDPRNGGEVGALGGTMPEVLGMATSPSGGFHFFVRSMGVGSRDAVLPGIDIKAGDTEGRGRGFAFIAPTVRKSKTSGELAAYQWVKPPDLSRLAAEDKSGEKLAALVRQARSKTGREPGGQGFQPPGGHSEGWTDPDIAQLIREGIPAGEAQQPILRDAVARLVGQGQDRTVCWGIWQAIVDRTALTNPAWPWAEADFADMYDSAAAKYRTKERARGADDGGHGEYGPQVVSLAGVEPERIDWLWDGHLPLGKVVVLDGDPGVGKSTVSLDIAARTSTGSPMPDGSAAAVKGNVLVLSAEDGLADTIRPRLDAAGADPEHVITITEIACVTGDGERESRPVSIPRDLPAIEAVITANDVKLVIIDVLMAYLSGDVNAHRDQDVRRALHALSSMAERTGCCVIVLRHLNKSGGANALYRGGGSIGIIGAARAGFMCGIDPDDETGGRRVFASIKMNIAAEPSSLAYYLVPDQLHGVARVQWDGVTERRARDLLAEPVSDDDRSERDQAAQWLTGYLTDNGGEAAAKDVKKAARADGIAERTLDRARARAKVTTGRSGFGKGAVYVWRLDLSCTPHARHERQASEAGKQGEHGGEHGGACTGCGQPLDPSFITAGFTDHGGPLREGQPVKPAVTAMADQAQAASDHAHATMETIARHEDTPIRYGQPGAVIRAFITSMHTRGITGQLTLCPHLSYDAPQPAAWCAWAPGRLRCNACAAASGRRIRGTKEDKRCDHCRKIVPVIHSDMAQLPPVVVDLPPWPPKCVPPITMMFGLCPACQATDAVPGSA